MSPFVCKITIETDRTFKPPRFFSFFLTYIFLHSSLFNSTPPLSFSCTLLTPLSKKQNYNLTKHSNSSPQTKVYIILFSKVSVRQVGPNINWSVYSPYDKINDLYQRIGLRRREIFRLPYDFSLLLGLFIMYQNYQRTLQINKCITKVTWSDSDSSKICIIFDSANIKYFM